MEYEFYIDLFFLTVFFLNFLSLFLTGALGRLHGDLKRMIWMAAAGAAWNCVLFLFPFLPALPEIFLTVLFMGSAMTAISFSLKGFGEIIRADMFLAVSVMLTGGCLTFLKEWFWMTDLESLFALGAASLGIGIFLRAAMKEREIGKERFSVRLYYKGRYKEFLALADSGNRLREPISGKPVSIISFESCQGFCDGVSSVLYIPYRAVGTKEGMLPGIIFEKMEVRKNGRMFEIDKPIVAVTREPLSGSGDFSMLIPEQFVI